MRTKRLKVKELELKAKKARHLKTKGYNCIMPMVTEGLRFVDSPAMSQKDVEALIAQAVVKQDQLMFEHMRNLYGG